MKNIIDTIRQKNNFQAGWQKLSVTKALLAAMSIIVVSLIIIVFVFLLFTDAIVNKFGKPIIITAIADAFPDDTVQIMRMQYSIMQDRFEFDSLSMHAKDGSSVLTIAAISVNGLSWLQMLLGADPVPDNAKNTIIRLRDIALISPLTGYENRIEMVSASVPDSEIVIKGLTIRPTDNDELFFEESAFRRTRFRGEIPVTSILGFNFYELLQGKGYRARSVRINDLHFNILVNNDKSPDSLAPSPLMPNEVLASVSKSMQIDKLSIRNAQLQYGERSGIGIMPAVITFDSIQLNAEGFTNIGDKRADIVIHTRGMFMKRTPMNVIMAIPMESPDLSFRCYGSVGEMNLRDLNSFLEPAEQIRIAGLLKQATFKIEVTSGRASGTVLALYHNVTITAIDKHTGSAKRISDQISSFIANAMVIRKNNMPGGADPVKTGRVKYVRKPDDPFFRYAWFSLRSGVKDIVGF